MTMDHYRSREMALRLFACDCAVRALHRWMSSGREPDQRNWEVIRKVRSVAEGRAPESEIEAARELKDEVSREFIESEVTPTGSTEEISASIREQLSWYGALNAVSATCNPDYEDAAEYAAREARREARRVGDEPQEIMWQVKRLEQLRIIPRGE